MVGTEMQTARQVLHTLSERSRAPLFHGTNYLALFGIYNTDTLEHGCLDPECAQNHSVSFTRDLRVAQMIAHGQAVLVLDQDKVRARYAVEPFDYWASMGRKVGYGVLPKALRGGAEWRQSVVSGRREPPHEAEERVRGAITPLRPLLLSVSLNVDDFVVWSRPYLMFPDRAATMHRILRDPLLNAPFSTR